MSCCTRCWSGLAWRIERRQALLPIQSAGRRHPFAHFCVSCNCGSAGVGRNAAAGRKLRPLTSRGERRCKCTTWASRIGDPARNFARRDPQCGGRRFALLGQSRTKITPLVRRRAAVKRFCCYLMEQIGTDGQRALPAESIASEVLSYTSSAARTPDIDMF